jgi:hypothetical protein
VDLTTLALRSADARRGRARRGLSSPSAPDRLPDVGSYAGTARDLDGAQGGTIVDTDWGSLLS